MTNTLEKYIPDKDKQYELECYFKELLKIEEIRNDPELRPFQKQPLIQRVTNEIVDHYSRLLGFDLKKEIHNHLKLLVNEEKAKDRGLVLFKDFINNTKIESSWVVQGLIPVDILLIVASAKTGKSDLIANLNYCLITGEEFLGFPVKPNLKIGIGQLEEADHSILNKAKFHGFKTRKGQEALEKNPIVMFRYLDLYNEIQDVIDMVDRHKLDVLILDTAITAMSPSGISLNQVEFTIPFRKLHSELCIKRKCALIVLHHTNKEGKMMGTNALPSIGGGNWILERVEDEKNKTEIKISSRETGGRKLLVERYYKDNLTVGYKILEEEEEGRLKPLRDRLVSYLLTVEKARKADVIVELDFESEDLCNEVIIDAVVHQLVDFEYDENDEPYLFISENTRDLFKTSEYFIDYKNKLDKINEIVENIEKLSNEDFKTYIKELKVKLGDSFNFIFKDVYDALTTKQQIKFAMIYYPHEYHEKELDNGNCLCMCTSIELNNRGVPINHKFTIVDTEYNVVAENLTITDIRNKYGEF